MVALLSSKKNLFISHLLVTIYGCVDVFYIRTVDESRTYTRAGTRQAPKIGQYAGVYRRSWVRDVSLRRLGLMRRLLAC